MKKVILSTGILMVTAITMTFAQYNADDNDANGVNSANTNALNEIQKEGAESNQNAVSVFTRNQFASDFPDATNIRFEKTDEFDKVDYSEKGRKTTAYYDINSELLGTLRYRSFGNLPANAQTEILNKYPGFQVVSVVRFNANGENEDDNSHYFVELKNGNKSIVLMVGLTGEVSFFTTMK